MSIDRMGRPATLKNRTSLRLMRSLLLFVVTMICMSADAKSKDYEWRIVNDDQAVGVKDPGDTNDTKNLYQGQSWMVSQKAVHRAVTGTKTWLLLIGAARSIDSNQSGQGKVEELENFWVEERYLTKLSEFSPVKSSWPIRFFAISIGDWCHTYHFSANGTVRINDCSGEQVVEIGKGQVYVADHLVQIRPKQGFPGAFSFDPASQTLAYSGLKSGIDFVQKRFGEQKTPLYLGKAEDESGVCVLDCVGTQSSPKKSKSKVAKRQD
jgi:hypothetical protein